MFNRNKLILLSLMLFIAALPTVASAEKIEKTIKGDPTPAEVAALNLAKKTVASKAYVDTKQDKIVASDILLLEEDGKEIPNDIYAPSIVTHDSNDETLVGTQFGILSNSVIDDADIGWEPPYLYSFSDRDDLVPTVAAIIPELDDLWGNFDNYGAQWETLAWTGSTGQNSQIYFINNYTSSFEATGPRPTIGWPADSSAYNYLVNHKFLVNALALKQNKIAPSGSYYNSSTGALTSYNTNASNVLGSWLNTAVKGTGLVTKTSSAGVVGERKIFEASDVANYHATGLSPNQMDIQDISIPTVGAVKSMLASPENPLTWDTAETAAANAYSTTFSDSGTNTWPESDEDMVVNGGALANALSLKQNKITTGLVELEDIMGESTVNVPALVATNAAGTELSGNTIGIVRHTDIPAGNIFYYMYPRHDNFVPSLRLVASELYSHTRRIYDSTAGDNVTTLSNILGAVNAYSAMFSDSGTNTWPSVTQNRLVNGETLAWTLGIKQNKINSTSNGTNNTPNYVYNATTNPTADGSVVTTTTTQGVVSERGIAKAPVSDGNGGYSNGDWLPTVNAMMNAINSHTPTGTQNTIANYGANGALGSGIATYDGSGTYAPATDAGKIATAAAVETKQNKIAAGTAGNVVTYTGTAGSVGSATVSSAADYTGTTLNNGSDIANITAVETKQNKIPAGTAGNVVTYTGTAGSVGSATVSSAATYNNGTLQNGSDIANITAVETKQDKITTSRILFHDSPELYLPSLVSYGTAAQNNGTDGLLGNKVGILTSGIHEITGPRLFDYSASAELDNIVPSLSVMAEEFANLYSDILSIENGINASIALKQNKIPATSDGSNSTPNYVYNATTNPTAAGSVVTTTGTAGTVAQVGIATAPTYTTNNNVTTLSNGDWLPTMGAVESMVSGADISAHKVNGAPLSNSASVFFDGEAGGAVDSPDKTASIPSITTLSAGTIITVLPKGTSDHLDGATYTLKLNNFSRAPIYYNGYPLSAADAPDIWNANYPSTFVYDGTNWRFMGSGAPDNDTTYASMGVSEGTTGTTTTQRSLTATNLKQIIQGTTLTGLSTSTATAVTASDTVTTGIGKLQGQVNDIKNNTVNGAPLSTSASYFYDPAGGGAASDSTKTADIMNITTLAAGQIIVVKPSFTSSCSPIVGGGLRMF